MSEIIRARDIVKRYGTFTAVDGISFSVRAGECFGFLGPNGAGKTTTIRMITCVSPLTAGELTVDGMDVRREPRRIKAALGVVPQLLTTHYMDEAAHLCDRIVIIFQGKIIAEGTPAELVERFAGRQVVELHVGEGDRGATVGGVAGGGGGR